MSSRAEALTTSRTVEAVENKMPLSRWFRELGWRHLVGLVGVLFALYPVAWIVSAAFNSVQSLVSARLIPRSLTTENFTSLFGNATTPFARWIGNSYKVALTAAIINVLLASLAAASLGLASSLGAAQPASPNERITRSAAGPAADHAADELRDPTSFDVLRRDADEIAVKPRGSAGKGTQRVRSFGDSWVYDATTDIFADRDAVARAAQLRRHLQHADAVALPFGFRGQAPDDGTVHPHVHRIRLHRPALADPDIKGHAPSYRAVCVSVKRNPRASSSARMRRSAGARWNSRPAHNPKQGLPVWLPCPGGRRETAMSSDSQAVAHITRRSPGPMDCWDPRWRMKTWV